MQALCQNQKPLKLIPKTKEILFLIARYIKELVQNHCDS